MLHQITATKLLEWKAYFLIKAERMKAAQK